VGLACVAQVGADDRPVSGNGADVEGDGPPELIEHLHAAGRRLLAAGAAGPDQRAGGAGIAPSRSNG
jgi:hypothetical protein